MIDVRICLTNLAKMPQETVSQLCVREHPAVLIDDSDNEILVQEYCFGRVSLFFLNGEIYDWGVADDFWRAVICVDTEERRQRLRTQFPGLSFSCRQDETKFRPEARRLMGLWL